MSPRTKEQNEEIRLEKRQLILDTALELFADKSYHSTSISQIAKKAGISKGLMYNYFESKEDLLQNIFDAVMGKFISKFTFEEKDNYSKKEVDEFFDNIFEILIENPNEWKLYYQLSFQTEVMEILMKNISNHQYDRYQNSVLKYLMSQNYKDPEVAILLFSSLMKGFVLQYAFAPELFNRDVLERFKAKLKALFFGIETQNGQGKDLELNEGLSYLLL